MNIILYDGLIPGINQLLNSLQSQYRVQVLPESELDLNLLQDRQNVEAVFVRSTTKVNESFLDLFPNVKFLATATSGTDHLDTAALERRGIAWMDAKGSNAKAVADYVACVLMLLAQNRQYEFNDGKAVIVGYGCVGCEVKKNLASLGLNAYWVDPFLNDRPASETAMRLNSDVSNEDWLALTSLLCLHTPLRLNEPWPTSGWLNDARLSALPDGAVVIAAGRGEMLVQDAVLKHADRLTFVLDVWPSEPDISRKLLDKAAFASPHIAGHSKLGKLKGSWQVAQGFLKWAGFEPLHDAECFFQTMLSDQQGRINLPVCHGVPENSARVLNRSLLKISQNAFSFESVDASMRKSVGDTVGDTGHAFKLERKRYEQHPEIFWDE